MYYLNIILNIAVVCLHSVSVFTILRCAASYQEKNPFNYNHKRWLSVFNMRGEELGLYLLRLILSTCLIMFAMNLWHLFTYTHEGIPLIKNISWRTGNFLVALTFLIIAYAFKRES